MAHYQRVSRGDFGADAAVHPKVDIAAADADVGDADDDIVGVVDCGNGSVLILSFAGSVEEA